MWVVAYRGTTVLFADREWSETESLSRADRFQSRSDAVACAAAMRMACGGSWIVVKFREALRW